MFLGVFEAFERHCATVDDQVRQLSSQPGSLQIVCCPFNFILISAELLETSFVLCYSEEAHRTFFFVDDFLSFTDLIDDNIRFAHQKNDAVLK